MAVKNNLKKSISLVGAKLSGKWQPVGWLDEKLLIGGA